MRKIMLPALLTLASYASYSPAATWVNSPLESFTGSTIKVHKEIIIEAGETFNGNGNLYDWTGAGDCSQKENMPPMFILKSGATLKNVWMRNAPDGIHVRGSNITIDNIINVDVCEDAVSISKSKRGEARNNINIINSKFYHCEDKAIQLTRGSNILIKHNEFYNCAKAVRIKEYASDIRFENNKVLNAKNAIKVTGGHGYAADNLFTNARIGLWAKQGGNLIDGGNNTFINVKVSHKETENGKIHIKSK